jgi:hypothetical protein
MLKIDHAQSNLLLANFEVDRVQYAESQSLRQAIKNKGQ